MAEPQLTSASTTGVLPTHGSTLISLQNDVDTLKREIDALKTTVGSLVEEIKDFKRVKVEMAALRVPPAKVEVKIEELEPTLGVDSEETPAPFERIGVTDEEQECMEVDSELEYTSQDTGDASERTTTLLQPPRRQTTEEPKWDTPPCGENLFKVNPEYAQRIARAAGVVVPPVQVPTPPPQPREETPPPPPHLPPPPPAIYRQKPVGIIPASQAKRKINFELIIEIPAKRFKASFYPTPNSSSSSSAASSSRVTLDTPVMAATRAPVKKPRNSPQKGPLTRIPQGITFKVDLDPEIRDIAVTRRFMWAYFGAHQRYQFVPLSQEHIDKHGYDHFVFIREDYTSQPPTAPGKPGFITLFDGRPWRAHNRYRIFTRIKVASVVKWQYMGLYKATKLPAWTSEELMSQRATEAWSLTVRETRWARPMLARIMLRQELGREPTPEEVEDQVVKLKTKCVPPPSLDAIAEAFGRGEEKAYPWKLECEGYEENLQREIAIAFPHHELEAKPKKSKVPANG